MGSATIRLNSRIIDSIRARHKDRPLGDGTMVGLVSGAIKLFRFKHNSCFNCKEHIRTIAGIELARQKALRLNSSIETAWVGIRDSSLETVKRMALSNGTTARNIVEQAVAEHVMRPAKCNGCQWYGEMCDNAKIRNRRC